MITGFNTDIKHGKKVFHIQTEDRGRTNPIVESLVYVGGEILLSKRSPYADLIQEDEVDEPAVRQMMDAQHRLLIEAIKRGRFDSAKPGGPPPALDDGLPPVPARVPRPAPPPPPAPASPRLSAAAAAATAAILSGGSPAFPPRQKPAQVLPVPKRPAAPSSLPISPSRAAPPPALVEPGSEASRSLDQVIIDYLALEAASDRLEMSFVRVGELVSGEVCNVTVKAATSLTGQPVPGANITMRVVVSTAGPAKILYRGTTGPDGVVRATVAIPQIGNNSAALIVAGTSAVGSHEIKQLIKRK